MKALISLLGLLAVMSGVTALIPLTAQPNDNAITCTDGTRIDNGVAFVLFDVQPGFTYTATAIGIDGFDPIIALQGEDTTQCNDDDPDAANFAVDLPTTGEVDGTSRSAQIRFTPAGRTPQDASLLVGGFNGQAGEFVLLIEGLAATDEDDPGDLFEIILTPQLIETQQPLTVYMIGVDSVLDPALYLADAASDALDPLAINGEAVVCDDAGNDALCYGEHESLAGASVSRTFGRTADADRFDAMLDLDLSDLEDLNPNDSDALTLVMGKVSRNGGQYIVAVHTGAAEGQSTTVDAHSATDERDEQDTQQDAQAESRAPQAEVLAPTPTSPPAVVAQADAADSNGVQVTCTDGKRFDNGVAFVVNQMRPGFTYTATVIGLRGFDPILAVVDDDGDGTCNDDSRAAAAYSLDLPSTGAVNGTSRSAQIRFTQNSDTPDDIALVVGGFNNQRGQFVLILEGMATTIEDDPGDVFSVQITPDLINEGEPLHVYMLGVDGGVDPLMVLADDDFETRTDAADDPITCDDAGNTLRCWGAPASLRDSTISRTRGREVIGEGRDAVLVIPAADFEQLAVTDDDNTYLRFIMTRYQGSITGDYIVAFHAAAGRG